MSLVILLSIIPLVLLMRRASRARITRDHIYYAAGQWLFLVLMVSFFSILSLKPAYAAPIGAAGVPAVDGAVPTSFIAPHALMHNSNIVLAFVHDKFHVSLRSRSLTRLNTSDTAPGARTDSSLASLQQGTRVIIGQWLSAAVNPVKVILVLFC
jgi:hypothetical protein